MIIEKFNTDLKMKPEGTVLVVSSESNTASTEALAYVFRPVT